VDHLAELDALDAGVLLLVALRDQYINQSHLLLQLLHLLPQPRFLSVALLALGALGGEALELLGEAAVGALRSLEPHFGLAVRLLQLLASALQHCHLGLASLELAGQLVDAGEQALLLALEGAHLLLELAHLQHLFVLAQLPNEVGTHLQLESGNRPPLHLDLPAQAAQLVLQLGRLVLLLCVLRTGLTFRSLLEVDGDAFEVLKLASLVANLGDSPSVSISSWIAYAFLSVLDSLF
jgi:hypothetical protein